MYQPFQEFLEAEIFSRFQVVSRSIPAGLESKVSERGKNPARIQSWCYECPQFRKIRYTYIDAGETAQIFNSVIYPNYNCDLPILGIDFLSFGKVKNLVVLDFQPLFRDEQYQKKYIEPMRPIWEKYDDLAQDLPMKFYDANQYFSKYILFAKTDAATVREKVFSAYQDYIHLYWELLQNSQPISEPQRIQEVINAQKAYDQYSADRDPASGLFSSYFGHEWAERFLYEFLFEDAVPLAVAAK
ncbi:MAG TPA: 15,16-dihydrobiliverdin:ferredoxin oxidoreductase [Planktothrix sp. UBA8407]|jgi:Ferredoxin-dependent bilin reductase.|nr:15,16-dihydrobiliverdin:ferredoxin oxidoreductase [Planktothrix sp. UBA8402]HAO10342.1 15,16-dihydrobiliverdin:ferredoxin oxidoreductase [Planktothrix sp. UBA8407]HBK22491.1 15,16-dihydrobiliverdin:ferredoxin oxidoreductase [Planktothrix sp. UBA10369]